jgi:hypothetical protein
MSSQSPNAGTPFQFYCPTGHLLEGNTSHQGQQVQCPYCRQVFLVPQASMPAYSCSGTAMNRRQVGANPFILQRLLGLGGSIAGLVLVAAMFLQLGGDTKSTKSLRDFGDNTSSYKGKTLTFKLTHDGQSLDRWMEKGVMQTDLLTPFRAAGFIKGNYFHYDLHMMIPDGMKVPPIHSGDDVYVTFECTQGDLHDGNIVKKIARP